MLWTMNVTETPIKRTVHMTISLCDILVFLQLSLSVVDDVPLMMIRAKKKERKLYFCSGLKHLMSNNYTMESCCKKWTLSVEKVLKIKIHDPK